MEKDIGKQVEIACQGTEDVLVRDELVEIITQAVIKNEPLKVKLGLDPTAPDIHLGHTVVLNKLRQFQDLGHKAILIIGDYTARIGDLVFFHSLHVAYMVAFRVTFIVSLLSPCFPALVNLLQ